MSYATESNPMFAPIHGISLRDYAAMTMKMANGIDPQRIYAAMGIDEVVWHEVQTTWTNRMREDTTFAVTTEFGKCFTEGATHPNLENLQAPVSAAGAANLEKLKTDRYFYEELCGARNAAYAYGMDGAQWILDNYGISLGDFQAVSGIWSPNLVNAPESALREAAHFCDFQEEKRKEYAARFAAEQGGNVADDVEF